jgi:hypothetical protein
MRGQLFRNFPDDTVKDFRVERPSEISQYLGGSDDHKLLKTIVMGVAIQRFRDLAGKPFFRDVMPIGVVHGTSRHADARGSSPRAIGALFAGRWVVLFKNLFDLEIDLLRVAFVAQEEGFFTVANKNESVVRNPRFAFGGHFFQCSTCHNA